MVALPRHVRPYGGPFAPHRHIRVRLRTRASPDHPDRHAVAPCFVSVIIPTRNEAGNIPFLLDKLRPVLARWPSEIIFVDDSEDDTPSVIRHERETYDLPVHLIHRPKGSRAGGLGGAVVEGMRAARGTWMIVMDGDLQHPPEIIPSLVEEGINGNRDLVVANRYCKGGDAHSFSVPRLLLSKGSTFAAKTFFPARLRDIDDPMTGFFAVRRGAVDLESFRPNGFKILLEIAARTPHLSVGSVPFHFGERHAGESKASLREGLRFISLLCTLRFGQGFTRFASFGVVGISGLVVNTVLLALWTDLVGLYYMFSLVLAAQGSSLWNFFFSEHVVFSAVHRREGEIGRAAMFLIMNNLALIARGPIVYCLTSIVGINYLVSNVLSMVALLLVRYAVADSFIWKPRQAKQPLVHGLAPSGLSIVTGHMHDGETSS